MSTVNPVEDSNLNQTDPTKKTAPVTTDTNTQVAGANATGESKPTSFNTLKAFEEAYPDYYDKMIEGMMMAILKKDTKSQERMKQIWRKNALGG